MEEYTYHKNWFNIFIYKANTKKNSFNIFIWGQYQNKINKVRPDHPSGLWNVVYNCA